MNTTSPETRVAPDLVGMLFHIGRDVADQAGLALANPDPDGPPIAALAWPGTFYITSQTPAPGEPISQGGSIAVTVVRHGDEAVAAVIETGPRPPRLSAHAEADAAGSLAATPEDTTLSAEKRPQE